MNPPGVTITPDLQPLTGVRIGFPPQSPDCDVTLSKALRSFDATGEDEREEAAVAIQRGGVVVGPRRRSWPPGRHRIRPGSRVYTSDLGIPRNCTMRPNERPHCLFRITARTTACGPSCTAAAPSASEVCSWCGPARADGTGDTRRPFDEPLVLYRSIKAPMIRRASSSVAKRCNQRHCSFSVRMKRSMTPLHWGSPTNEWLCVIPSQPGSFPKASAMYCGPQSLRR